MKPKVIAQIVIDALMTLLLTAQMGLHFWAEVAHEWIGVGLFALFIAHHVLNWRWYTTLFKSKSTPYRTLRLVIDLLVLVDMIGLMVSGIMLSQYVFAFFLISAGKSFARTLHLLASYWGLVLMAFHLGLRWDIFVGLFRKSIQSIKLSSVHNSLLRIAVVALAAYGVYAFIQRNLLSYLLLQNLFVFFDYEEPLLLFYLDYLAMLSLFVWSAHHIGKRLLGYVTRDCVRQNPVAQTPGRKSDE